MNCQSSPLVISPGQIWNVNINASAGGTHSETRGSLPSWHKAKYLWLKQMFHHSLPASYEDMQVIPETKHPPKSI